MRRRSPTIGYECPGCRAASSHRSFTDVHIFTISCYIPSQIEYGVPMCSRHGNNALLSGTESC